MPLCKIDGIEYEAPAEVCRQLEKTDAAVAAEKAAHDATKAERDTLKAKNDELAKVDVAAEAQKLSKARTALERQATPHLDTETIAKLDSISDEDVRKAVILKAFPKAAEQLAGATPAYLAARYDAALEILAVEGGDEAMAAQRATAGSAAANAHKDSVDSEKSRNDFAERAKNAWQDKK